MLEIVYKKYAKTNTNSVKLKFAKLNRYEKFFVSPKTENELFS